MNKILLVGRVGADPEVKQTTKKKSVARIRFATTERWNDAAGKRQERTDWHTLVIWGKPAEVAEKYIKKGFLLEVEGRLHYREYVTEKKEKRTVAEIVVDNFQILTAKKDQAVSAGHADAARSEEPATF
jgi:single-strand DNA-binding protein